MEKTKMPIQKRRPKSVIRKGLPESLPTAVQKSYFRLSDAERNVLNLGLQKFRLGQTEPILVGGEKLLKPALQLMNAYRLRIDDIKARTGSVNAYHYPALQSALVTSPCAQKAFPLPLILARRSRQF
jgi:hypothetical protein